MKLIRLVLHSGEGEREVRVVAQDVREALGKLPEVEGEIVVSAVSEDTDIIL